ncbi:ribonuclease T2 family protein [Caminibacter sp.]
MKKLLAALVLLSSLLFAVSTENILALSWENSYCRVHPSDKACRMRKPGDYSLTHFTLHGLWPKKRNYCHVKYKFHLSPLLWKVLKKYMPAASYLAKHEWKKHGTCFGTDVETYFLTAIKLTQEFNETLFLAFVRMHMDQYVSLARIRYVFANVFGQRNVRKFQLVCERKNGVIFITEIRLNLKGNPVEENLEQLLNNAKPMLGVKQCQGGIFASP